MTIPFSAEFIFNINALVVIGWIVLMFFPRSKWKNLATFTPAAVLSCFYLLIIIKIYFFPEPGVPSPDFYSFDGWLSLLTQPYLTAGFVTHMFVVDLWLGRWMAEDFYSDYRVSESTFGSVYFKVILLITFLFAPVGFLLYFISVALYFRRYPLLDHPLDSRPDLRTEEVLDKRPVRFGEDIPEGFRQVYYLLIGLLGAAGMLVVLLIYLLLIPFFFLYYLVFGLRTSGAPSGKPKLSPKFLRTATAQIRLKLMLVRKSRRGIIWTAAHRMLQMACFIEFMANGVNPDQLYNALCDTFGDFFPFGDGIGVANREDVIRILHDPNIRKGPLSLGWEVSTSQFTFSTLTTIFLSGSADTNKETEVSRKMAMAWIKNFPHDISNLRPDAESFLNRILPPNDGRLPDDKSIYKAVGNTIFFIATDGQMKQDEREAYTDAVVNSMVFFPDWFNFLLGGHVMERKGLDSYYKIRKAFSRYMDGPALQAVFEEALRNEVPRAEALRLITVVYGIAGAAAPAKLAAAVISRLHENPAKMVPLYDKAPFNFILECARLDKAVPMVNVFSTKDMSVKIGGKDVFLPENTPLHCSLVNANRDAETFGGPNKDRAYALTFDPDRENLRSIISWNGLEQLIEAANSAPEPAPGCPHHAVKGPPRACPGHDFSINVIKYLADRYKPTVKTTSENGQ